MPQFLLDAAFSGAAAYLPGEVGDEEFLSVVDAVLAGQNLFPREVLSPAFQPIILAAREQDVLKLLAEGKTDREVAAALGLALSTVRNHSPRILEKLEVHSRAAAVQRARRLGVAPPPVNLQVQFDPTAIRFESGGS